MLGRGDGELQYGGFCSHRSSEFCGDDAFASFLAGLGIWLARVQLLGCSAKGDG